MQNKRTPVNRWKRANSENRPGQCDITRAIMEMCCRNTEDNSAESGDEQSQVFAICL